MPLRQDGGIVCALCDGGVKLMVEVAFTLILPHVVDEYKVNI